MSPQILRYAAFTEDGRGGNPAGVVLDASRLTAEEMQAIALDIGYSETAFLVARSDEPNVYDVRYFAPLQEVPFCGHATLASAVAVVERSPAEELIFHTPAGFISISSRSEKGVRTAELTSVAPSVRVPEAGLLEGVLQALRWSADDLDPRYPVRLANAGANHLILVVRTRQRLADLDYDFDALATLMQKHGLITVALLWREGKKLYHARNPFAGSGVVEDPATGAAAAAFGGYLRELGMLGRTGRFTILQGADMGRPSRLEVSVLDGEPGVRVSGKAQPIPEADWESSRIARRSVST